MIAAKDSLSFLKELIDTKSSENLITYENTQLENKYPDFRYLMNEFHDGMLLFNISGEKVWNRVSNDSSGLRKYYEDHKDKWISPEEMHAIVYTLKSSGQKESFLSTFREHIGKQNIDEILLKKYNTGKDTLFTIKEKKWNKGENSEIDNMEWKTGSYSILSDSIPTIVLVKKISEPTPMKYEDAISDVMNDYQDYLDKEWIKQLNKKYTVKVDNSVLDEIKNKLKNE
jgi:peptidyl-prolyl cis-trans isomerase SurA